MPARSIIKLGLYLAVQGKRIDSTGAGFLASSLPFSKITQLILNVHSSCIDLRAAVRSFSEVYVSQFAQRNHLGDEGVRVLMHPLMRHKTLGVLGLSVCVQSLWLLWVVVHLIALLLYLLVFVSLRAGVRCRVHDK